MLQQFAGQNIINYFSPIIFRSIGLSASSSADLLATGIIGIVRMIATVPALFAIDKFGRRPLLLGGTVIMALSFYYIGGYLEAYPPTKDESADITAWGYLAVSCVYTFIGAYSMSWGVLHYVIPSEVFPTHLRAKAETLSGILEGAMQIASIQLAPLLISVLDFNLGTKRWIVVLCFCRIVDALPFLDLVRTS
jgi:MFS family permease